jgi:two-component system, OmpR family, sensor kinase
VLTPTSSSLSPTERCQHLWSMNAESDLLQSIEELRAAVRARDEFLAIAAHELRSPMHALLLQATTVTEVARRGGGNADLIRRLERMNSVLERYVKRATTLLEISRINAGRLQLRPEHIDLAEVVRETVECYGGEAAHQGVHIEVLAPDALHGRWDRQAVEQIVANLVSNAIKYGDGQPMEVRLDRDEAYARLVVRDRGVGLSAADQLRIFERFEQAVTEHPRSGFGVGLWLVRNLVEAHRGSIEVESTLGSGATFTVRLALDSATDN